MSVDADSLQATSAEIADRRRSAQAEERRRSVFIGVGRPSTAAMLARMVHNPDLVLVYESGTIGAKPFNIPISIGDGELAQTADVDRVRAGDVQLLDRAGPDRRRVPRRGADRSLCESQHHGHRRLRAAEDPAAGRGRRARDRRQLRRGDRDRVAQPPDVRRATRLPDDGRPWRRARRTRAARVSRRGPDLGDHRPRGARARSRQQAARACAGTRRCRGRPGARDDRLGARSGRRAPPLQPPTERRARQLCGS